MRENWVRGIVDACQTMAGRPFHPRPEALSILLHEFIQRLSPPRSPLESSFLKGHLMQVALRWGDADHLWYHREYGPSVDSCAFVPSQLAADVWKGSASDQIALFAEWSRRYRHAFALTHPMHVAMELRSLIDRQFPTPLSLSEFASQRTMSVRRLQATFLKLTGRTILDYLTARRVDLAVDLLRASDDKVETIARDVGWASRKNLNRALLKHTGKTPAMLRASRRSSKPLA